MTTFSGEFFLFSFRGSSGFLFFAVFCQAKLNCAIGRPRRAVVLLLVATLVLLPRPLSLERCNFHEVLRVRCALFAWAVEMQGPLRLRLLQLFFYFFAHMPFHFPAFLFHFIFIFGAAKVYKFRRIFCCAIGFGRCPKSQASIWSTLGASL